MGISHLLHYYTITGSFTLPQRSYHIPNSNRSFSTILHCRSPSRGGGGSPRRNSNIKPGIGVEDDGGDEFEPRVWWSNAQGRWDYDDEDPGEDDLDGFGVLENAINVGLLFKVLKAIGWMIPAILMWVLVGNVPNTFFMALAIPIAQSAVDLMTNENRRTKKSANKTRMAKKRRDEASRGRERRQTSKSANNSSKNTSKDAADSFGGWDELDNSNNNKKKKKEVVSYEVVDSKSSLRVVGNEANEEGERRLSKRMKSRERPLMVRLLIAAFPFLGTWMKVM